MPGHASTRPVFHKWMISCGKRTTGLTAADPPRGSDERGNEVITMLAGSRRSADRVTGDTCICDPPHR